MQGEDVNEHCERNRRLFQQSIPNYPMLGRIFDMYEDYVFTPEEVERLREECLRVKSFTSNPAADLGLRKLIYARLVACNRPLRAERETSERAAFAFRYQKLFGLLR